MIAYCLAGIGIPESDGDVLAAEKGLPIARDGANGSECIVSECLNLVSHGGVPSRDPVEKKSCRAAQGVKGLTPLPTNLKVLNPCRVYPADKQCCASEHGWHE